MNRRAVPQEKANTERWLYTYSDLMNNLLVMFMVMYIMSVVDLSKFETLAASFSQTLLGTVPEVTDANAPKLSIDELSSMMASGTFGSNTPGVTPTPTPSNGSGIILPPGSTPVPNFDMSVVPTTYEALFEKISRLLQINHYDDQVTVEKVDGTIYLRFREGVFFLPNSTTLKQGGYPILDNISKIILESYDLIAAIEISGHTAKVTEGLPSKSNLFSWELSADRALTVLKYMIQNCNIPQEKLSVAGYSCNQPIVDGNSEKYWAQNRRVEIRMTQKGGK